MYAFEAESTAMALALSAEEPPKNVEYRIAFPLAFSLVMNASKPPAVELDAPGKLTELVVPVT